MDPNEMKLSPEQQQQLLFMMLVQQHEQIGMMGLGKIKDPATDSISVDLNATKYAIDTLQMLEKYTSGNLDNEMKSYLQHVLNTLRLNYADEVKASKAAPSKEKE
jgi:hypothetical protein